MSDSTKEQQLKQVQHDCEIRANLLKIVDRQRSTITMLLSLLEDLGFDISDLADVC